MEKKSWEDPQVDIVQIDKEKIIAASGCSGCYTDTCPSVFSGGCLTAGTKVTMADGSLRNIEEIKEGERIMAFDHETGTLTAQEVYIAFKGEYAEHAFTLHFEDGTELSIVGIHDLFEKESMKYVRISDEHAEEFIGKHFYSIAKKGFVALDSVTRSAEKVEFYSLYPKYNFNSIVNGMLSVPDDVDEHLNIYEFDENLKADAKTLAADLARYGVHEYSENDPCTKEEYNALNLRYLNIIIGKGFATRDELIAQHEEYLIRCCGACRKAS